MTVKLRSYLEVYSPERTEMFGLVAFERGLVLEGF